MTYTHTYTRRFSACTYTPARDLHAHRPGEREQTYTHTYTTYTRPDLHARTPLYRGGRVGLDPIQATLEGPR